MLDRREEYLRLLRRVVELLPEELIMLSQPTGLTRFTDLTEKLDFSG